MIINMNGAKAPETPSPVLQEKTVTPETLPTVIGADEGYDGLSQVTVNPDANLKPTNIRSGKTIFGVEGSFVGSGTTNMLNVLLKNQLTEITAEDLAGVRDIPQYAFYGMCSRVKSLEFSPDNKTASTSSFSGMSSCRELVTPSTFNGFSYQTFSNCGFDTVTIGDGPTVISDSCFYQCLRLKTVHLPNTLKELKYGAFQNCYKLESIEIPSGVVKMGDYCLSSQQWGDISKTLVVTMKPTTPPTLGSSAFTSSNLIKIVVPIGTLEAYQTATNWANWADFMEEATE